MDENKEFVRKLYKLVFPYSEDDYAVTREHCERILYQLKYNLCKNEMKALVVTIAAAMNMRPKEYETVSDLCNRMRNRVSEYCRTQNVKIGSPIRSPRITSLRSLALPTVQGTLPTLPVLPIVPGTLPTVTLPAVPESPRSLTRSPISTDPSRFIGSQEIPSIADLPPIPKSPIMMRSYH